MNTTESDDLERRLRDGIATSQASGWTRLRAELATQAGDRGLLDVGYSVLDTPLGELLVAATPRGVVRLAFHDVGPDAVLEDLAARVSPRLLEAPARLDAVRRELDEYFDGTRRTFEVTVDWSLTTGFRREVLAATARIPYGHTGTYRSVATEAGRARAVRAAGTALATNPVAIIVPCHRVLRSDGSLGGYGGGLVRKETLLQLEAGA